MLNSRQPVPDVAASPREAELQQALYTLHTHAERQARWLRRGILLGLLLVGVAWLGGYGYAWHRGQQQLATAQAAAVTELQSVQAQFNDKMRVAGATVSSNGITLPPSPSPAIRKLQKVAATGDYKTQVQLAAMYETGVTNGVERDSQIAQSLLQNAAAGGFPAGMYELGRAYASGRLNTEGKADRHAAARWLEAAAATGHAAAAFELGTLYESGLDGAPDTALALSWYQRAASYGSDTGLAAIARLAPRDAALDVAGVQELQKALRDLGYDVGTADGKLNRRTVEAIRTYQAQLGLAADGRPSRSLLERVSADRVGQGG